MRGLLVCLAIAIGCGVATWVYRDSDVSMVFMFVGVWVVFLAIRHGLQIIGGKYYDHDDSLATGGILSRPPQDQSRKKDGESDVSGLAG